MQFLSFGGSTRWSNDLLVHFLRWQINLQRSKDGINFETLGSVAAQGNSTTINHYNFDDVNPFTGPNYYRLELVSIDGSLDYSNTVLLVISDVDLGYVFYPGY